MKAMNQINTDFNGYESSLNEFVICPNDGNEDVSIIFLPDSWFGQVTKQGSHLRGYSVNEICRACDKGFTNIFIYI